MTLTIPPVLRRPTSSGFTLFEVGISLLLVSFGVVSVLMIFPVGLKQTQASKYKIIAAAKAVELVDSFAGAVDEARMLDAEVPEAWEGLPFCYTNYRWDLEQHICNFRYGIQPLPLEIARRLDSEGNEIQRILDEGGYIYYTMPMANLSLDERWQSAAPPNESRNLIFAVVGQPQHNAIPRLPQKAWPYRHPYPSPPLYFRGADDGQSPFLAAVPNTNGYYPSEWWLACNASTPGARLDHVMTNTRAHPLFPPMFRAFINFQYHNGDQDWDKSPPNSDSYSRKVAVPIPKLREYIESTIDYCRNLLESFDNRPEYWIEGMNGTSEFNRYFAPKNDLPEALAQQGEAYDRIFADYCSSGEIGVDHIPNHPHANFTDSKMERAIMERRVGAALRVQAFRYLSAALTCLYDATNPSACIRRIDEDNPTAENRLAEKIDVKGITVYPGLIRYLHERSLSTIMRYSACFPYDWGCPRPQQRQIMMDFPLIELDMFSRPRTGTIGGSVPAAQWKPISAQPITNLGPSLTFPGTLVNGQWQSGNYPYGDWDDYSVKNTNFWGNPDHFTLTKTFAAAERCRQLVFWSVDWQQYEDFESAPSAPMDASRHPFTVPRDDTGDGIRDVDQRLTLTQRGFDKQRPFWRMSDNYATHNPELRFLLSVPANSLPTGASLYNYYAFGTVGSRDLPNTTAINKNITFGLYGADRNFNKILDRGPLKTNVRLRASSVGRFLYYDPRIPVSLR